MDTTVRPQPTPAPDPAPALGPPASGRPGRLARHERRLPAQITVNHGPAALLRRFFLEADAAAERLGVTLRLHHELDSLIETNRRLLTQWAPLVPIFDPGRSDIRGDAAFWIEGCNATGETVATQAARFLPWFDTNLAQELATLRLFYDEPEEQAQAGERIDVLAPSASLISGRVVYSGAGWYRRDYRGIGLSAILPRISRAYGLTRWGAEYTVSLAEPVLVEKGVTARYGYRRHEPMIRLRGSYREDLDVELIWMSAGELVDELQAHMGQAYP